MTESEKIRQYVLELLETRREQCLTRPALVQEMRLIGYNAKLLGDELDILERTKFIYKQVDGLGVAHYLILRKGLQYLGVED